jgi:predicted P-loop ATPase
MIARAIEPGCICRTVIILEGPEEYRKSTFVASLVPFEHWYAEITGSLESKEAHLMVQGLWVAELSELDSLGRTEETRLKSFISMRADAYIPKFKMTRVHPQRRAIFVGTTNEHTYLKGVSGNTRYLPFEILQPMDVDYFLQIREQLVAEAMVFYHDHQATWWQITADVHTQAVDERESRRQASIYESDLHDWLITRRFQEAQIHEPAYLPVVNETSWAEIASGYLQLDSREKWKDSGLQRQIAQALRATGWVQHYSRSTDGTRTRVWRWTQPGF